MKFRILTSAISLAVCLFCPNPANAVPIGNFPGFDELIARSDAVVILRVDGHVDIRSNPTLYTTHDCYIYQTLKGDIRAGDRIQLRLMDTRSSFVTPFALYSTHLMFLTKKRSPNEPTEYRTIEFIGSQTSVPPTGNETMPAGETVQQRVASIVRRSIEYNQTIHKKNQAFLEQAIADSDEP